MQAYVESLRMVWTILCAISGLMLLASVLFIKEISLERELETEQGFRYDSKNTINDGEESS